MKQHTLLISFDPAQWGHSYQATRFAGEIETVFEIPVQLKHADNRLFEVFLDQTSVYRKQGRCQVDRKPDDLIAELAKYLKPIETAEKKTFPEPDNSPEYQQWMRSVCSGE